MKNPAGLATRRGFCGSGAFPSVHQFVSSSGIGKLDEIMNPDTFIRVHRSTIINLNYLKEIERHFNGGMVVKMQNGKSFPVSRTYAKAIRKKVV